MKKLLLIFLGVIFMLSFCGCNSGVELDGNALFIAHRGYSYAAYQNTIEAFRLAGGEEGFWGIETDVQYTSDGKFVCAHDANPFYSQRANISELTYNEAISEPLDAEGKLFICDFNDYLDVCLEYGKKAVIEIKFYPEYEQNPDFMLSKVDQLLSAVYEKMTVDQFVLICFDSRYLARAKENSPDLEVYWLMSKNNLNVEGCIEKGFNGSIYYKLANRKTIKQFHEVGLKVGVWTVNSQSEIKKMNRLGVDYITTDGGK